MTPGLGEVRSDRITSVHHDVSASYITMKANKHMTISQESALTGEKTATRPFTGAAYLESLRDGREVYIYGERVKDVTSHPAFRNSARMVVRLYDALHDPAKHDILTTETDTGSGGSHTSSSALHEAPRTWLVLVMPLP